LLGAGYEHLTRFISVQSYSVKYFFALVATTFTTGLYWPAGGPWQDWKKQPKPRHRSGKVIHKSLKNKNKKLEFSTHKN
jgi:hypothetical protein